MNSNKEIGILEISEILNKYLYFIIIFTVLFSLTIATNYYYNNYNLFKIKTKIKFVKSLESSPIQNLLSNKKQLKIIDPENIIYEIDKNVFELESLYSAYNIINKKTYNPIFGLMHSERFNYDLVNIETLTTFGPDTFIPYFLDQLTDYDKFKYFFKKNEIKDELLIKEIFNNLNYKFTDTAIMTSNFFLKYSFNDDTRIKIEKTFNQFIDSINIKIYNNQLTTLIEELEIYKSIFEEISVLNNKIINSFINDNEVRNIIKEKVYKKILDSNDVYMMNFFNDFTRESKNIENKIIFNINRFEKIRKLNENHIDLVKKEISNNQMIFSADAEFNVFDSSERINIVIDTIVVMAICLFFGFIISFFISLILFIKTLYVPKNK